MRSELDKGPLSDVLVIEVGQMLSGPTTSRILADFGATVIKIEHPDGGDPIREFGPQKDQVGLWHKFINRNKLSLTLNIKREAGQEVFRDLIYEADVLVENFRPDTLDRWGLSCDSLRRDNPGLIVLHLSGFGQDGPYADLPGFGTLAEAMSGFASVNGFPDRPPLLPPSGLADQISGVFGVFAVAFSLYERDVNDGEGQCIDLSLLEPLFSLLGPQTLQYEELNKVPERTGNKSPNSAPRGVYETADEKHIAISASIQSVAMRLFDAIERPELKNDERFATNPKRVENREELNAILREYIGNRRRENLVERFREHDVTVAPVYTIEDIDDDKHFSARSVVTTVDDSQLGTVRTQNVLPMFEATPGSIDHLGPPLGEDNEAVYNGVLNYDSQFIDQLESRGVI